MSGEVACQVKGSSETGRAVYQKNVWGMPEGGKKPRPSSPNVDVERQSIRPTMLTDIRLK